MKKFSLFCLSVFCAGTISACAAPNAATVKSSTVTPAKPVAAATSDQCTSITGFYTDHYIDTTGLFPNKNFPINLYLKYQNGLVYGYTLPSGDIAHAA